MALLKLLLLLGLSLGLCILATLLIAYPLGVKGYIWAGFVLQFLSSLIVITLTIRSYLEYKRLPSFVPRAPVESKPSHSFQNSHQITQEYLSADAGTKRLMDLEANYRHLKEAMDGMRSQYESHRIWFDRVWDGIHYVETYSLKRALGEQGFPIILSALVALFGSALGVWSAELYSAVAWLLGSGG